MKYKYSAKSATKINKHGVNLTIYGEDTPLFSVVYVDVKEGHFQEFYDIKSTYTYFIVKGSGIFYLNDEEIKVESKDLIVVPPKTRIHYFGTMEIVLTVTPAFNEKNERHVRFVEKSENPFIK